ncbi:hypothetical protein B0H14DRAFT_3560867 [Mycena olivaceomarginata]|nr:hypothetical protein B0H14DRAFT_3560867 [Mycena olivaceomarginata]
MYGPMRIASRLAGGQQHWGTAVKDMKDLGKAAGGGSRRDGREVAAAATREGIKDIAGEPGEVTDTGGSRRAVAEPRFLIESNRVALAYRSRGRWAGRGAGAAVSSHLKQVVSPVSEKSCFGCNRLSRLETFERPPTCFKPPSRRLATSFEPTQAVEIHVMDYKDFKPFQSFYPLQ